MRISTSSTTSILSTQSSSYATPNKSSSPSPRQATIKFQSNTNLSTIDSPFINQYDIAQLPSINSQNMSEYTFEAQSSAEDSPAINSNEYSSKMTGTVKIIGVPTDKVTNFASRLITQNRWLTVKYIRIDNVYQTPSSFSHSFNYIVTLDYAAYQACIENCHLSFYRNVCNVFNQCTIEPCRKCQSLEHSLYHFHRICCPRELHAVKHARSKLRNKSSHNLRWL